MTPLTCFTNDAPSAWIAFSRAAKRPADFKVLPLETLVLALPLDSLSLSSALCKFCKIALNASLGDVG